MSPPTEVVTPINPAFSRGGLREVGLLAYPVILTQMSMTAMQFVDTAMVGRLGAVELGAVGFGGIWLWTLLCLFLGTATGVQTFVSQEDGAGNPSRCAPWVWQALYVLVPGTMIVSAVLWFTLEPFLGLLGPSPELQETAGSYLRPRLFGAVGLSMAMTLSSFFRGIGDTRTPLYATLAANAVNVVLDYGLIFGKFGLPEWGVAGAGTATAIAEWVYAGFMWIAFSRSWIRRKYSGAPVAPESEKVRRFVRTGLPIGGQWVLDMFAFAVFSTLIARMGNAEMAASQAFVVLLSLSFMQAIGISVASSTLVGRYIGARDIRAARQSFRSSQKFAAVLACLIAIPLLTLPEQLLAVFSDDPEVLRLGRPLVMLGALFQLLDAFGIVAAGALRGAGDTRWPLVVQTLLAWGVFLPLGWLLGVHLGGGPTGAWIGGSIYVSLLALALIWRFRSGAWEQIQI